MDKLKCRTTLSKTVIIYDAKIEPKRKIQVWNTAHILLYENWEILPTAPLSLSGRQLHLRGTIRCLLAPSALSGRFSAVKGLAFCPGSIDHALKPGNE